MARESLGLLHGGLVVTCTRALPKLSHASIFKPLPAMLSYPRDSSEALFLARLCTTPKSMKVGNSLELSKNVTEEDITNLIAISGDDNPLHTDEEFAKRTMFKGRIVHGIISAALVSAALTKLFGPGNLWLSQKMKYTFPVRIGDTITAKLVITEIDKRSVCTVETIVVNQDGRTVLEGFAESKVMRIKSGGT